MRVLVTGSKGFVGKNLITRLAELPAYEVVTFDRGDSLASLSEKVQTVDAVVHLAGVNRPLDPAEFKHGNTDLTGALCQAIREAGRHIVLVVASSTQATQANPYGLSKKLSEDAALTLAQDTGNPVSIFRLPNVFGKWCKPNYNSVVATFCHNVAHEFPIQINNESTLLNLVYIDYVVSALLAAIQHTDSSVSWPEVAPVYQTTLGELAQQIRLFKQQRELLLTERTGTGFLRALYSTYLSYVPPQHFAYNIPSHADQRGVFVELLKTPDCGQFSFFTAHPGVTRGGHYHHTKVEKFLVIKGKASFKFKQILTGEFFEILCSSDQYQIVETIPGWAHDVTNVGQDELIVALWANETFNPNLPDTIGMKVAV
jgi:UDP-2-acetamido-2,6-beta-L-arabino-hexul-4-ose reductase